MKTTTVWIDRSGRDWPEWTQMLLRASAALDACGLPGCYDERWAQWSSDAVFFYGTPSECSAVMVALEGLGLDVRTSRSEEAA